MKKENRQRRHLKGVRFDDQEMDILERGRNATNASSIPEYLRDSGIVQAEKSLKRPPLTDPQWDQFQQLQAQVRISISQLRKLNQLIDSRKGL